MYKDQSCKFVINTITLTNNNTINLKPKVKLFMSVKKQLIFTDSVVILAK